MISFILSIVLFKTKLHNNYEINWKNINSLIKIQKKTQIGLRSRILWLKSYKNDKLFVNSGLDLKEGIRKRNCKVSDICNLENPFKKYVF